MARKFACGDVVEGCAWHAAADSDEDLFEKISKHAKEAHGISDIPEDLLRKVKSKIENV